MPSSRSCARPTGPQAHRRRMSWRAACKPPWRLMRRPSTSRRWRRWRAPSPTRFLPPWFTQRRCGALMSTMAAISRSILPRGRSAIGLVDRPDRPSLFSRAEVASSDRARGIATSGWRGRSFSLGIADAVTVLACDAAMADAAATIIANAVDLPGHPGITREPARALQPDSDLGGRLVTRAVKPCRARKSIWPLPAGHTRGILGGERPDRGRRASSCRRQKLVPPTHSLLLPHQPEAA